MAKTIKFNLICDRTSIRTLEDLQAHFSIEDVLTYYKNGILEKWLFVRDFREEYEAVRQLSETDDLAIAEALAKIFGIDVSPSIVEAGIYSMQRMAEDMARFCQYEEQKYHVDQILSDYENGYRHCIDDILCHCENPGIIRASVNRILSRYRPAFERDYGNLFFIFAECAPLAVFVMLTFAPIRQLVLGEETNPKALPPELPEEDAAPAKGLRINDYMGMLLRPFEDNEEEALESAEEKLLQKNRRSIHNILNRLVTEKALWELEDVIPHVSGKTYDTFQSVGSPDKKYMVILLGETSTELRRDRRSAKACATGQRSDALTQSQVAGKFPILEGLEYCGYDSDHVLFYLEV